MERSRIINRKTGLYLAVIGLTALTSLAAAEGVAAIDRAMKPQYVLKGNPAPPIYEFDEKPEWVRPTNWRVTFVDGRKEK